MAEQIHFLPVRAWDANGNPAAGAKAYFYESGTSTPVTVYSDSAATAPHASPVVANAQGIFPPVYFEGSTQVKVNVTDANDVQLSQYPIDPVIMVASDQTGANLIAFTPSSGNPSTNVQDAIDHNTTSFANFIGNAETPHVTTGTTTAFTASTTSAIGTGDVALIRFHTYPETGATLNLNGDGAQDLVVYDHNNTKRGVNLDWNAGAIYPVYNDGTDYLVLGPVQATEHQRGLVRAIPDTDLDNFPGHPALRSVLDHHIEAVAAGVNVPDFTHTFTTGFHGDDVALSQAHGLGGMPSRVEAYFECISAINGWAVGQRTPADSTFNGGGYGGHVSWDATNIYYDTYLANYLVHRSSTGSFAISDSNFNLVVQAWT